MPASGATHIEDIQDQVELALMRSGEHDVARAYVLYRERRASERVVAAPAAGTPLIHVLDGGQRRPLDRAELAGLCADACAGLGDAVDAERVLDSAIRNLYDGVPLADVHQALILGGLEIDHGGRPLRSPGSGSTRLESLTGRGPACKRGAPFWPGLSGQLLELSRDESPAQDLLRQARRGARGAPLGTSAPTQSPPSLARIDWVTTRCSQPVSLPPSTAPRSRDTAIGRYQSLV